MTIYPAIDLYEGKVVRLERGDYRRQTVYARQPEETAVEWCRQGAEWLHVVDLEGAKSGRMNNYESLMKIRGQVNCRLEFGGGIRRLEDIQKLIAEGIDRVILGTKALDEGFVSRALERFGKQIALGFDVRDEKVQMEGWIKEGGKSLSDALDWANNFPLETIIYTDIQKDGMLRGPNFEALNLVLEISRARVILSGGVSTLLDLRKASAINARNFEGVIIGKAIYEKKFSVREAIALTEGKRMKDG